MVHTSSTSGIYANPGQINYGTAKSGIVTFSQIAAKELRRYGVVSNCVVPGARTRLTLSSPGLPEIMEAPAEGFDVWSPGNVSPVVAYLSMGDCPFNGETFYVQGGTVRRLAPWSLAGESIENPTRWPLDELPQGDDPVQRRRALVGDGRHLAGDLLGGVAGRHGRLQRHQLHHVALHLDLAGEEGLHGDRRIAVDEQRSRRVVVGDHHGVGLVELAQLELHRPAAGVEVGVTVPSPNGTSVIIWLMRMLAVISGSWSL